MATREDRRRSHPSPRGHLDRSGHPFGGYDSGDERTTPPELPELALGGNKAPPEPKLRGRKRRPNRCRCGGVIESPATPPSPTWPDFSAGPHCSRGARPRNTTTAATECWSRSASEGPTSPGS